VKIARVLDEIDPENKATNLGKRKIDYDNRGPKGGNLKRFNTGGPQDKGKQPVSWQNKTPVTPTVSFVLASADLTRCDAMDVVKRDIR